METIAKTIVSRKTGKPIDYVSFRMTQAEYYEADEGSIGYCIRCGSERDCCEPDARRYLCEECGKTSVYGTQELIIMGLVEIV